MLSLHGVSKRFGATVALDDVAFSVSAGEVHALVGENGSGKSTLMRVVVGAVSRDAGSLTLDDRPFEPIDPRHARARGIAMIHQELSLCDHLTVVENVLLGVEKSRLGVLDRTGQERMANDALKKLGHGSLDLHALVGSLPISLRQTVEIARALAVGCKVIIFDEPTSSLTHEDAEHLFAIIDSLRASGHAVVYISHFFDEIRRVSDRVTVLRDGRIVGGGPTEELSDGKIIALMVGRELSDIYPRSQRAVGDVVLSVEGLSGVDRPTDVSLEVRAGEVVGIAGLAGAGRTELLRCLFGLDVVRSGAMRMMTNVGAASPAARWAQGAGMLSEDRKREGLALNMTIAENALLTCMPVWVSPKWEAVNASSSMERLAVKATGPFQKVSALSGGNQQKVALARLLAHDADLFLLDEPTRGIDVASKEQIYRLIDEVTQRGKAVLMVSSYLPELLGVCDRIAVMARGRLGPSRQVAAWTQDSLMAEAVS